MKSFVSVMRRVRGASGLTDGRKFLAAKGGTTAAFCPIRSWTLIEGRLLVSESRSFPSKSVRWRVSW